MDPDELLFELVHSDYWRELKRVIAEREAGLVARLTAESPNLMGLIEKERLGAKLAQLRELVADVQMRAEKYGKRAT